jgi:general secretion pathway protein G
MIFIHFPNKKLTRRSGFTLVEILAVIVLISLLAAFVVPRYFDSVEKARPSVARAMIAQLDNDLAMFFQECGRYPTQTEGLDALVTAPQGLTGKWTKPYCRASDLTDPWGNPFVYVTPGNNNSTYDVISYGKDGQQGGEGLDADLDNN